MADSKVESSGELSAKELKEKNQAEETENGENSAANGKNDDENGEQENEVEEDDEDVGEEEEEDGEGDEEDEDDNLDGPVGKRAAEDDDDEEEEDKDGNWTQNLLPIPGCPVLVCLGPMPLG